MVPVASDRLTVVRDESEVSDDIAEADPEAEVPARTPPDADEVSRDHIFLVIAGLATVAVLAIAIGIDLLRDPDDRSHLARFVLASGDDQSNFWTTISRKWATNIRVLQQSIWAWMVPIVSVFALYVLVVARGWRRLLPVGSAVRAAVMSSSSSA